MIAVALGLAEHRCAPAGFDARSFRDVFWCGRQRVHALTCAAQAGGFYGPWCDGLSKCDPRNWADDLARAVELARVAADAMREGA